MEALGDSTGPEDWARAQSIQIGEVGEEEGEAVLMLSYDCL